MVITIEKNWSAVIRGAVIRLGFEVEFMDISFIALGLKIFVSFSALEGVRRLCQKY